MKTAKLFPILLALATALCLPVQAAKYVTVKEREPSVSRVYPVPADKIQAEVKNAIEWTGGRVLGAGPEPGSTLAEIGPKVNNWSVSFTVIVSSSGGGTRVDVTSPRAASMQYYGQEWEMRILNYLSDKTCEIRQGMTGNPNYVLFFDFNSATPQADSKKLIPGIAAAIKSMSGVQVVIINGHTDTRGTKEYNVKLSQRRAENVKKLLAAQGVPASIMQTNAYDYSMPAVPTAPQVKEQRNRRVEIFLQ